MNKPSAFKRLTVEANSLIFDEGEPGDAAYLICNGLVEIRKGVHGSNPLTLATLGKGETLGELALFDDRPRMAAAVAVRRTELAAISRDEFQERMKSMDPVLRRIILIMIKRVRRMTDEFMMRKGEIVWAGWEREK